MKDSPIIGNMVTLKKGGEIVPKPQQAQTTPKPEEWVKAKEFVPGQRYTCSTGRKSFLILENKIDHFLSIFKTIMVK